MERNYPEIALLTEVINLRSRMEELAPSATPRQRSFRDSLRMLAQTLHRSIPGHDLHSSSPRAPEEGDGTAQVEQEDSLNVLVCIHLVTLSPCRHRRFILHVTYVQLVPFEARFRQSKE
jgi:hypothetical protein